MPQALMKLLRPKPLLIAGLVLLLWFGFHFVFVWTPETVITVRQEKFLALLSKKKWEKSGRYLSENYRDQWDFSKADAVLTLQDVGSQFFFLQLSAGDRQVEIGNGEETGEARMIVRIQGSGGPLAQMILARANRIQDPFVFHWARESWWPTTWRITRIENPGIPHDVYGYRPGDLRKAMDTLSNRLTEDLQ